MKQEFAAQYRNLEEWHWWFCGRQRILQAVLQQELRGAALERLASLGCGPAEGLVWLTKLLPPQGRVFGVDVEPLHARAVHPQIEYAIGDLTALPLAEQSFDAVLALDVLEHLDDDAAGLREAARLVKRGGLLLVTVPALQSLWGAQDVVSHHRRRYTKALLARTFAAAGLPRPRQSYFNTFLFPPVAGVRWTRRALGLAERMRSDFEDNQPGFVNDVLTAVFSAEQYVVPRVSLPIGVSLLATLHL